MTLLNPAKSMEVNDWEPDKQQSPRFVTLLKPAKSMEVSDREPDKK